MANGAAYDTKDCLFVLMSSLDWPSADGLVESGVFFQETVSVFTSYTCGASSVRESPLGHCGGLKWGRGNCLVGLGAQGDGEVAGSALGSLDCHPFPTIVLGEALALLGSTYLSPV